MVLAPNLKEVPLIRDGNSQPATISNFCLSILKEVPSIRDGNAFAFSAFAFSSDIKNKSL